MEVHDIVQEAVIKTILMRKMQKGKMVSEGALQIAEKRKDGKGKGKKGKIYSFECIVPKNSQER